MIVKGYGATLELHEDRLTITRHGLGSLLTHGLKGSKTILYSMISAVQFKQSGFTAGYIQFTIVGGKESTGGAWDAMKDENTVVFHKKGAFDEALAFVEARIGPRAAAPVEARSQSSIADQLEKLAGLLDRGLITPEEFQQQKAAVLGRGPAPATRPAVPAYQDEVQEVDAATQKMFDAIEAAKQDRSRARTVQTAPRAFGKRT